MEKELNILLVPDSAVSVKVRDTIQNVSSVPCSTRMVAFDKAWDTIVSYHPNVVILVAYERYDEYLQLAQRVKAYYGTVKMIVVSDNANADYILEAYKAGIKAYLKDKYDSNELAMLLHEAYGEIFETTVDAALAEVITVFSNKGGIGTTTVATNLASALAERKNTRVLLCDFVLHHGDVSIFLDTENYYTIDKMIANLARVDKAFLENSLPRLENGLSILHCPNKPEEGDYITSKQIVEVIEKLKKYFTHIVIDTSHDFSDINIAIFDNSDCILLLLLLELPSIRSCGKTLKVFQQLRYERDKVKLIINRMNARNQIDRELVEEELNYPIFHRLPNDYMSVVTAVNNGKSLFDAARSSGLTEGLRLLADNLSQTLNKNFVEEKGNIFSKLFKK